MRFLLCLLAATVAQKGKGKAQMQAPAPMQAPTQAQAPASAKPQAPAHVAVETAEHATPPVLINAVTDWVQALSLAVDNVVGISNHHHARWLGLLNEVVFKALTKNTNKDLTDDVVTAYASHQFLSYNFPQMQSGYFDVLMNVYVDYYKGPYAHRAALDTLVLPVVKRILVRETGSGIVNFVQNYVAPNTIGADHATLLKYEGKYQFTDVPNDKITVNYKDKPTQMNWQERGHFGTIKPYFNPLVTYVDGLEPIVVGTSKYNTNLAESQAFGSNDATTKDTYNWNTPRYWLNDWAHLPVAWTSIARSQLDPKLSNLESSKFFATLGLGIFEACNTCYGMKWGRVGNTSSLWRPETAIRSGDTFGNAAVAGWTPELVTPMHPEYPSGHCAHSGAAMEVLRLVLGKDDLNGSVVLVTDWSQHNPNSTALPNRKFTSLTQVEKDVGNSRVLGGVHYRSSCEDAWVLARKAAQAAYNSFYKS